MALVRRALVTKASTLVKLDYYLPRVGGSLELGLGAKSPFHQGFNPAIKWACLLVANPMLCLNDTVNTWACLLVAYPLPLLFRQDSSNIMGRVLN